MTKSGIITLVACAAFATIFSHPACAEQTDFPTCLIDDEAAEAECLPTIDQVNPPGLELRLWIIGYHRSIETSSNMRPALGFRRYDGSTRLRDMVTGDSADPLTSE